MYVLVGFMVATISMFLTYLYIDNIYLSLASPIVVFILINASMQMFQSARESKIRKSSINEINRMTGTEFEEYLYALLRKLGYKVQLTELTGDFGADLILTKEQSRIVVQAKRYKGRVGIKAVQEIIGAKSYYDADGAWVITNSYYTKPARELAAKSDVKLLDKNGLIELAEQAGITNEVLFNEKVVPIQKHRNESSVKEVKLPVESTEKTCPKCNSQMIIRTSKHGDFYGCTSFPKCKGTLPLKNKA